MPRAYPRGSAGVKLLREARSPGASRGWQNRPVRHNPHYANDDAESVRQLIRENPWGILVSDNAGELVASHYPILLDERDDGLAVLTHVGATR